MQFKWGFDEIFKQKNNLINRVKLAMFILIFALILFTGYYLIFYPKSCYDVNCFVDYMQKCKPASWIREDLQASWLYTIKGDSGSDACKIKVELLTMKEGTIEVEKLQGRDMICDVKKTDTQYPEKDVSKCTGELKEQIQDVMIKRMYNYILENIGEIQQEFKNV